MRTFWLIELQLRMELFIFLRGDTRVTRLSLGKLLVNLLQVVKRANTPLIP